MATEMTIHNRKIEIEFLRDLFFPLFSFNMASLFLCLMRFQSKCSLIKI